MENDEIIRLKNEFRKNIRKLKSGLSDEDKIMKSDAVFASVSGSKAFKNAKVILMYWSLPDEVQTHDAVRSFSSTKKVLLPVVKGDELELKEFRGDKMLSSDNDFGIGEPVGEVFSDLGSIDIVVVPGVAFDKQNNRLGRGRAYYDKLLGSLKAYKIGVCFDFQFFDEVPHDENDIKMDEVIFA